MSDRENETTAEAPDDGWRRDGPLRRMIDDNFIQYAAYVIRDRAIPELNDGLKPVQRRILHALHETDDGAFIKVANIVGHTMQYHPHGDASIADALVTLANKEYLIERQGNFGNLFTGDPAAASRYIECRLTPMARRELFNDELTKFTLSYDGRRREPVSLPCKLPLLLMLGAEGIAVGLSTRVLPHNLVELLEAQIAHLKGQPFALVPDFPQGGVMDAGEYDDGAGRVRLRARIDLGEDGASLIVRSVPAGVTTDSLIASIETAARKKKIAIRSIDDFTAEQVEVRIALAQDQRPDKTIKTLYAFTQCETTLSSRIVVISRDRPVEMTVSDVLKHTTRRLLTLLRRELEAERRRLLDEIQHKTLAQIFIEERIYTRIESCTSAAEIDSTVLEGVNRFRDRLRRDVSAKDVERLLAIKIKRISRFDIERNRSQIDTALAAIEAVDRNLQGLTAYAIRYLRGLIRSYGTAHPRRTETAEFESVVLRELTADELTLCHDADKGYLGHAVRGEPLLSCSSLDRLLVARADGRYSVIAPPEKLFVDRAMPFCGLADRDAVFVAVFVDDDGLAHVRRFRFGGTVLDREYRLAPPGSRISLLAPGDPPTLYTKSAGGGGQAFDLTSLPIRTPRVRAHLLTAKPLSLVSVERPKGWSDKRYGPPRAPLDR